MRTIYKYRLPVGAVFHVAMPTDAKIIHVGNQDGSVHIWAEVENANPRETRNFVIVGTGHEMPRDEGRHIGSAIVPPFVWHVYEIGGTL